jgi:hypothetical protein
MSGIERIGDERKRQIECEGWSPDHDDEHENGELALAAVAYALHGVYTGHKPYDGYELYPYEVDSWRPSTRIRNLEKAGALIAAEIGRLSTLHLIHYQL